ncbi:205_t:CDS:10 [Paraglomus brasilianum]|uniref:Nuclear pore complex protein n=1 Tax=Paraglomus brasilianum TaxID=144538 RepID=A0A9N9FRQ8_9GLOM|nr:205_t:CDS:10 [Paraglomus brasilianum]
MDIGTPLPLLPHARMITPITADRSFYMTPVTSFMRSAPTPAIFASGGARTDYPESIIQDDIEEEISDINESFDRFAEPTSNLKREVDDEELDNIICSVVLHYEKISDRWFKLYQEEGKGFFGTNMRVTKLWESERNTWKLIRLLKMIRDRSDQQLDLNDLEREYASDAELFKELLVTEPEFAEAYIVRLWLQEIAPEFEPVEVTPNYLPNTLEQAQQSSGPLELDPDGPIRLSQPLADPDDEYDRALVKSVFEYIRRGQGHFASDLCEKSGHYWRAASIGGCNLYDDSITENDLQAMDSVDSEVDGFDVLPNEDERKIGAVNRSLWRSVCFKLAADNRLDHYERAAYGALCGDLDNTMRVCNTWEDYVWVFYNAIVEDKLEQHLRSARKNVQEIDDEPLDTNGDTQKIHEPSVIFPLIENLFTKIQSLSTIRDPDQVTFQEVQKLLILNKSKDAVEYLCNELEELKKKEDPLKFQHLLRFTTHYVLYLKKLRADADKEQTKLILKDYVKFLITLQRNDIIALYTSMIDDESEIIDLYAYFLSRFNADVERYVRVRYLSLLTEPYGLPMTRIARRTVQMIFEEAQAKEEMPQVEQVHLSELGEPITPDDHFLIVSLDWLTVEPEQLMEGMIFANALCRRFLLFGRLNAFKELMRFLQKHPQYSPMVMASESQLQERTPYYEFAGYSSLLEFFEAYDKWYDTWTRRPTTGQSYQQEAGEWKLTIEHETAEVEKYFRRIMYSVWGQKNPQKTLTDVIDSMETGKENELNDVRYIYIPELVIRMHNVLYETRQITGGNLAKSLNLANVVADAELKFYEHFQASKKMTLLLTLIRDSSLALIEDNGKAFA